jgi:DNA polymerase-3 subunit delta'
MGRVVGHRQGLAFFHRALARGSLAHAYLIAGPAGIGKETFAREVALAVLCAGPSLGLGPPPCERCPSCLSALARAHPDLLYLSPLHPLDEEEVKRVQEGVQRREISIRDIRRLISLCALTPRLGGHRVVIIDRAEQVSEEAGNALLKTLEEPPRGTLFLLLSCDAEALLPTLRSRCLPVHLGLLSPEAIAHALREQWGVAPEEALLASRLAQGRLGWALRFLGKADPGDGGDLSPLRREERTELLEEFARLAGAGLRERFAFAQRMVEQWRRRRPWVLEVLDLWAWWWRDLLFLRLGFPEGVVNTDIRPFLEQVARQGEVPLFLRGARTVLALRSHLEANVQPPLALEYAMLRLPRLPVPVGVTG